jgi:hypothetical protein
MALLMIKYFCGILKGQTHTTCFSVSKWHLLLKAILMHGRAFEVGGFGVCLQYLISNLLYVTISGSFIW